MASEKLYQNILRGTPQSKQACFDPITYNFIRFSEHKHEPLYKLYGPYQGFTKRDTGSQHKVSNIPQN